MKFKFMIFGILTLFLTNLSFASGFGVTLPLPGMTMANEKLQFDTLQPVYMAVGIKAKNCNSMNIVNTKVVKEPYNLKYRGQRLVEGQWEEVWSVNACSKIYDVPIKFILDEKGASYMISPKDILAK